MATIGSLAVNIVATTDKFIAGLNNASGRLGKFVKGLNVATTAASALGAYGLASVVQGAIEAGGALFDLSAKLNISTEALGALDYAASQTGVSTNALHNSLSILSRRIGEANMGSKSAVASFSQLGIKFEDIQGIPIEQQFLAIIDALNKVPDANDRAAMASDIFGKSAKELTALIQAGSAEIVRFSDEAKRMGILLSEESAQKLDDAGDAISRFSQQMAGLKMNMVADYAPEIELALDMISGAINVLRVAFFNLQAAFVSGGQNITEVLRNIVNAVNTLLPKSAEFSTQFLDQLRESLALKQAQIQLGISDIVNGREGQGPLQTPAASSSNAPVSGVQAQKKTADNTAKQIKQNDDQLKVMREMRDRLRGNGESVVFHAAPVG